MLILLPFSDDYFMMLLRRFDYAAIATMIGTPLIFRQIFSLMPRCCHAYSVDILMLLRAFYIT